jgi:phosphohistidine phosphatase SixA
MRLILVRHGQAGRKADWHRADKLRPLSPRGRSQAEHLVGVIAPLDPMRILTSPHVRCVETVGPLAAHTGLAIERSSVLSPDEPAKALRLVRKLSAPTSDSGVVLCTHREVIERVLPALSKEDEVNLERRPPGLKGSAWILDFRQGRLVDARYVPAG